MVEGKHLDPLGIGRGQFVPDAAQNQFPRGGVLDQVGGELGDDQLQASGALLGEADPSGQRHGGASRRGHLAGLAHGIGGSEVQRHLRIVTRVPSPTRESMANSLERRRAPDRPSPRPSPVV